MAPRENCGNCRRVTHGKHRSVSVDGSMFLCGRCFSLKPYESEATRPRGIAAFVAHWNKTLGRKVGR